MTKINDSLPNFLVIGAPKSGTTSLYNVLKKHPQIFLPDKKELHFFNNDKLFNKGIDWYKKSFDSRLKVYLARGEITPAYLFWGEKVIPRIINVYGEHLPKLIAMLRDPVDRAYSRYWHQRRIPYREPLSFEEALRQEESRLDYDFEELKRLGKISTAYFKGGLYAQQLTRFFEHFPSDLIHIIKFEDYILNFEEEMTKLLDFLEVDSSVVLEPAKKNSALTLRSEKNYYKFRSYFKYGKFFKKHLSFRTLSIIKKLLKVH